MLKVIDDGVVIELNGTDKNPMFWLSFGLIALALGVAFIAATMPVEVAMGSMALFAVLVFGFNILKNKQKTHSHITSGKLTVKRLEFVGGGEAVKLSENASISTTKDTLVVADLGRVWHISGFDSQKELLVAQSVLEGKPLQKREQAIRLL